MPVATLLGGFRDRAPAYASGALMRTQSLDEVVTAAGRLVERGWTSMKTQLALPGGTFPEPEVDRIRRMRDAIGPDVRLMCDINQLLEVPTPSSSAKRLEPYICTGWRMSPPRRLSGACAHRRALTTPIAAGEYLYGIVPFRHLLESRSIDIVMIDLLRVGGITQWMKVAGMAEAFNLPVVSI